MFYLSVYLYEFQTLAKQCVPPLFAADAFKICGQAEPVQTHASVLHEQCHHMSTMLLSLASLCCATKNTQLTWFQCDIIEIVITEPVDVKYSDS